MKTQKLSPCLWFDNSAEDAAKFYTSIFKNSKMGSISYYGNEGQEIHGKKPGSVMAVYFEINGIPFTALNGGPQFKFSEAISFQVLCETQDEIDYYWNNLTSGGEEGPCGWLKDKYGLSWQIVPAVLPQLMADPSRSQKVMHAFMKMKKMDIQTLENA